MNYLGIDYDVKNMPVLDEGFIPFGVWMKAYLEGATQPIAVAVEREDGLISVRESFIRGGEFAEADFRYVERLVKFELWSIGGFRVYLRGCDDIAAKLAEAYSPEGARSFDYGFVGDIESVNHTLLGALLGAGVTPVFCAIMHDGQGTLLNCNADSVASAIALGAAQIAPAELVFCFEKSGVLRDPDDETTLIREITAGSYAALKAEGVVSKGMIPKIENALKAVANGVRSVTIKHSDNLSNDTGTVIR